MPPFTAIVRRVRPKSKGMYSDCALSVSTTRQVAPPGRTSAIAARRKVQLRGASWTARVFAMHFPQRLTRVVPAALIGVLLVIASPSPTLAQKDAPLNSADLLLVSGEYRKAADSYRPLSRSAGTSGINARLRLVAALLKRDNAVQALTEADAAVAAQSSGDAYALRSLARFRAGRFALAEADRDAALAAPTSESMLAHYADANLLGSHGAYDRALAALDRALKGRSLLDRVFRPDELVERSGAFDELDRTADAIGALADALAVTPRTNDLLINNMSAQLAFRRQFADREFMRIATNAPQSTLAFTLLGGLPVVNISVNGGAPAPFIVDTGAGVSVLFPAYARKIGFDPRDERAYAGAVGGDGKVGIRYGLADSVRLGDHAVLNVPFAVLDWELPNVAGIVGLPLLRPFVTTFDYPAKELRLARSSTAPQAAPAGATPFRLISKAIYNEASINGRGPFNFGLDTGASTNGVPIDEMVASAVGLNAGAPGAKKTRGMGAAGGQDALVFPNGRVAWAGMPAAAADLISQRITPARAERRDGESGLIAETEVEGLIGYALLKSAVITIDFERLKITIA